MPQRNEGSAELLAADSFRVRPNSLSGEPEVRGGRAHVLRFALAVREASAHDPRVVSALDTFLDDATAQIAAYGTGWPRLELWAQQAAVADSSAAATHFDLRLALRPLPELGASVGLRTARAIGVRRAERKGPNIARYAELNRHLEAEALLIDENGYLLEGATTSLVWWQNGMLCAALPGQRVDSITEAIVLEYANRCGIRVMHASVLPSDLAGAEVWALNALHGIRPVTRLDGRPLRAPLEDRLREFTTALDRSWRPLR